MVRANPVDDGLAELFIKTVQGDYSPESCALVAGKLEPSNQPVAWHARPNLALLSKYLRVAPILPVAIEEWLVALFDQDYATWGGRDDRVCRVKEIRRRKRGRTRNAGFPTWASSLPSETQQAFVVRKSSMPQVGEVDDLTILSRVLDENRPLPTPICQWLADMFDPVSTFAFRIRTLTRRIEGSKPIGANPWAWGPNAARMVLRRREQGTSRKTATYDVAKELDIPFDTVAYAVDLAARTAPPPKK